MKDFHSLPLPAELTAATDSLNYIQMTPIQAESLPVMLKGQDVVAQARTGSGKTAAFALALLAGLRPDEVSLQKLVLCPTRELADQVAREIRALARLIPNVKISVFCGGVPVRVQVSSLRHQPHIIVGTPGRLQDLLSRDALSLDTVDAVVLDEADRMLDMGFIEAVQGILAGVPKTRKTWLFSATYPPEIAELSRQFQRAPVRVSVQEQHDDGAISQVFFKAEGRDKPSAVLALLADKQPESCLIFCNTRNDARDLTQFLIEKRVSAAGLHGEMEQRDRDETLLQFANGSFRVLVATDVAARGLDIKDLPLVISYEPPPSVDVHTHRVGRTGRAGSSGLAYCLVAEREQHRAEAIETALRAPLEWRPVPPLTTARLDSPLRTLMIEAGRRDKLRPGDIVGALTADGGIEAAAIGKIDVLATRAYVAIPAARIQVVAKALRDGKIKGQKRRMRIL